MPDNSIRPKRTHTEKQRASNIAKRKYPDDGYGLHSRLYRIWRCMEMRCYKPSHEAYRNYGGRGIIICAEWLHDYLAFKSWALANGYADHLTIDRVDNDGNYEPSNCRWIDYVEQSKNRRTTVLITAWGETKPFVEWLSDPRCQVPRPTLWHRLGKGEDPESAMCRPSRTKKESVKPLFLTAFGETKSPAEWVNDPRCVVTLPTFYHRFNDGWSPEDIITRPLHRLSDKYITINGETLYITEWYKRFGTTQGMVKCRRQRGWTFEEALTTPPLRRRKNQS